MALLTHPFTKCILYSRAHPFFIYHCRILRSSDKYLACSTKDKFSLLRYLLSSYQYSILEGICLLPLRNGSFIEFNRADRSHKIFKTSLSKMQLLVGMEDQLLQELPTDIDELFSTVINEGTVI